INIADLSPIGTNFGRRVEKYNVYRTLSIADLPAGNAEPVGSGAELLGSVAHAEAEGTASQGQLRFSFVLDNAAPGWFYFVRPADGNTEGTPSNIVSFGAQGGNLSPVASFTADPTSGDAPLTVGFDASGSSDPDGTNGDISDIVQFQWDFEGDGIVDESSNSPTTQHTYLQPGQFEATLVVFDSGAGFAVSSVAITAGQAGNLPPTAVLSLQPVSGQAPLPVQFDASASTDDGGAGNLTFEWDFNGDGLFDLNSGSEPTAQRQFNTGGEFSPLVRVTDAFGLSATATASLSVADPLPNESPSAVLSADQTIGNAPLSVEFDPSASSDPDGSIAATEMDFDGDGNFDDFSLDPLEKYTHIYETAGNFNATLRVSDDRGAQSAIVLLIQVSEIGNQAPQPSFTVQPQSGNVPLEVEFDASASTDPDGTIVSYAWDFNNDGLIDDNSTDPVLQHTFVDAGQFTVRLTVTDNEGKSSSITDFNAVEVSDPGNQSPTAVLSIQVTQSGFPTVISLDPSASSDPDGSISKYEYDFDGDGDFEISVGSDAVQEYPYFRIGTFTPVLRVTDNDGASSTDSDIAVQPDQGWSTVTVDTVADPGDTSVAFVSSGINGLTKRFVVCYTEDPGSTLRSSNAPAILPTSWTVPVQAAGNCRTGVSLIEVDDAPAAFFTLEGGTDVGGVGYVRALDGKGNSWGTPQTVATFGAAGAQRLSAVISGGNPGVLSCSSSSLLIRFIGATDSTGSAFSSPVNVFNNASSGFIPGMRGLVVNDRPAVLHFNDSNFGDLEYRAASSSDGSSWPANGQVVSSEVQSSNQRYVGAATKLSNGFPMVAYEEIIDNSSQVVLAIALNQQGSAWLLGKGQVDLPFLDDPVLSDFNLELLGDLPVISFRMRNLSNSALAFAIAEDPTGLVWGPTEIIDGEGRPGKSCSLVHNGTHYVISQFDENSGEMRISTRPTSL
ncbi:PKD domain-containing protein, partial [bacterium]|nr:PKD domain-containing protein [bacterium]